MRNKVREAAIILLAVNILLILYSFVAPQMNFSMPWGSEISLRFIDFGPLIEQDSTVSGGAKKNEHKADSILRALQAESDSLAKDSVANIKRRFVDDEPGNPDSTANLYNTERNGKYALDEFFRATDKARDGISTVRVAFYGDSQIEGDRISEHLRRKLQAKFGGSGSGFLQIVEPTYHQLYNRTPSDNWKRAIVFFKKQKSPFYGLSGNVYKFSGGIKSDSLQSASFTLSPRVDMPIRSFSVLYGKAESDCYLIAKAGKAEIDSQKLVATDEFVIHKTNIKGSFKTLRLEFAARRSPDFYGFLIDGDSGGVQVDNYAIRGHSGNGLLEMDRNFWSAQLSALNTKLIILEYGMNVIPYLKSEKSLDYIVDGFKKLFARVRSVAPNASVLVVGINDYGVKKGGSYVSLPNIAELRDALKSAAFENEFAYWDMYEAMGGENSFGKWVEASPSLAYKDGHLTPAGQKVIAGELYKVINNEYRLYRKRNELRQ